MAKVIGFIPARGGSKGIPRKNIHMLNGQPLINYTVTAALESGDCDTVVVSTEDEEIKQIARAAGASVDNRPAALAGDDTSIDEVILEYIQRNACEADDIIMLLQPTSPLRKSTHIREALQWFLDNICEQNNAEVLLSVYQADSKNLYLYREDGSFMKPVCDWATSIRQRQALPNVYLPNRAIAIFKVGAFLAEGHIPKHHIVPFVMSKEESVDIDTTDDLRRTSYYLVNQPERRSE